jgi:hypothetical protein
MKSTTRSRVSEQRLVRFTAVLVVVATTSAVYADPRKEASEPAPAELTATVIASDASEPAPAADTAKQRPEPEAAASSATSKSDDCFLKPEQMELLTDILRFFTDNTMKFLSSNRDNQLEVRPHSNDKWDVLAKNKTKLLSDNSPELLTGNSVKVLSDVRLFSNINLNVNIHVENSGNKDSTVAAPDKVDSAFRRLDRDGDGKISPAEFRAGMAEK